MAEDSENKRKTKLISKTKASDCKELSSVLTDWFEHATAAKTSQQETIMKAVEDEKVRRQQFKMSE